MWRPALCLLLVSGCDRVLQLVEVKDSLDAAASDASDARVRPVGCPAGYDISLPSGGSFYKTLPAMSWREAASACAGDRVVAGAETHLLVLSNDIERAEASMAMGAILWWIGYSDLHGPDDQFRWVTAEDTGGYPVNHQIPWDSEEPDQAGAGCAEVRETGQLHDEACADLAASLCECDAFPDVPANR